MDRQTAAAAPYITQYRERRDALPGADLDWLVTLRDQAIERFAASGLPGMRDESWKYTRLRPLERKAFAPLNASSLTVDAPSGAIAVHSLADGLAEVPGQLSTALIDLPEPDHDGLLALNTSLMADGAVVVAPKDARAEAPVTLLHRAAGEAQSAYHPRHVVFVEEGAEAIIVERYEGEGGYWMNPVTDVVLAPNATLKHLRLQQDPEEAVHTGRVRVHLSRDATYDGTYLSLGAGTARTDLHAVIADEGADCRVNGTVLGRNKTHGDITTIVEHRAPNGTSDQLIRNVLDDRSRAVFQGKVLVEQPAQKTDASQNARSLLLSRQAEANAKPELRIFADDVKCAHGATVGELEDTQMFYLLSRGIDSDTARRMLIQAFVADVIDRVPDGQLRAIAAEAIGSWLGDSEMFAEVA